MSERLSEKHEPTPLAGGARRTVPADGGAPACAPIADDFWPLLDAACADELTEEQAVALQTHLASNPAARREYIAHIRLRTNIRQWWKGERSRALGLGRIEAECSSPPPPTVVVNPPLPSHRSPLPALLSSDFVGGWAFSYIVASVFVCLLLLGFWAYKLPSDRGSSIASSDNSRRSTTSGEESIHDRPAPVFVGRVTGIAGAKWSDEPNYIAPLGYRVALGRTYKLKSGLLEITYDSGAKVILEGPCDYEVDSTAGGYLSLGQLVARVEAGGKGRGAGDVVSGQLSVTSVKEEGGRRKEEGGRPNAASLATTHQPLATNSQSPSPLSPLPSPLFTVRTPTAIVTDLGTEFGVEVAANGDTTSHVFQGRVVVRAEGSRIRGQGSGVRGQRSEDGKKRPATAVAGDGLASGTPTVTLDAGESARVQRDAAGGGVVVRRESLAAGGFVRDLPRWTPIKLFNTGVGLKEGDADPHWRIVARSDDPEFKPIQAVATSVEMSGNLPEYYLPNNPARSQWLSIAADLPKVPRDATFTFRTTFELNGLTPGSAFIRGRFLADNHVTAIRLNGRSASIGDHNYEPPFNRYCSFAVREGFVEGINVLEIEVSNQSPSNEANIPSPVALLLELEGRAICGGRGDGDAGLAPYNSGGKEGRTTSNH